MKGKISVAAVLFLALFLTACGAEPSDTVRLSVSCAPENARVTVFKDGVALEPESDGSYLLSPGTYSYSAECEGYISVSSWVFTVDSSEEQTLELSLSPLSDGFGVVYANPEMEENDFLSDFLEAANENSAD